MKREMDGEKAWDRTGEVSRETREPPKVVAEIFFSRCERTLR
jgi:hypothetical protein